MKKTRLNMDFAAGVLFLAFSLGALVLSSSYSIGTPRRMGPAFFPLMVGGILGFLSILLIVRGIRLSSAPVSKLISSAPILILGSITLFMVTLKPLGFPIALGLMVIVASFASNRSTFRQTCLLAAVLAVSSALLFKFALGQALPVCGWLFAEQLCPARWS